MSGIFFALLLASSAQAQTFTEALSLAYQNNPELAAAQAKLRAVDTELSAAQSGWRPTAQASGETGFGDTHYKGTPDDSNNPSTVTGQISQPVFRGGRTLAATREAKSDIKADRARLHETEQTVLLNAASAYLKVLCDQQIVSLNHDNVAALDEQLTASQHRYKEGELTLTDVRQSELRLAGARADVLKAEATLEGDRATFVRLVGDYPANLAAPDLHLALPGSRDDFIKQAESGNTGVIAARYAEKAAMAGIDASRGSLLPEASINGDVSHGWNQNNGISDTDVDQRKVVLAITIPLYDGGTNYAKMAAARETTTQRKFEYDNALRIAHEQAITVWANYQAAEAALKELALQVEAAQAAIKGVREESKVGTRTVLDVLDAEQELRNARINQVQAERDSKIASFQILEVAGGLTPQALALPGDNYDPQVHYDAVDRSWFGD